MHNDATTMIIEVKAASRDFFNASTSGNLNAIKMLVLPDFTIIFGGRILNTISEVSTLLDEAKRKIDQHSCSMEHQIDALQVTPLGDNHALVICSSSSRYIFNDEPTDSPVRKITNNGMSTQIWKQTSQGVKLMLEHSSSSEINESEKIKAAIFDVLAEAGLDTSQFIKKLES